MPLEPNEVAEERLAIRRQELMLGEQIEDEEIQKLTFGGLSLSKFRKSAVLRVVRMLLNVINDLHDEIEALEAEPKIELATGAMLQEIE